jgi:hypothetical protein
VIKSLGILVEIYLHLQQSSHIAAGTLLFSQILMIQSFEIQSSIIFSSASCILTDISNTNIVFPFNYGAFDGLFMLMNQLLNQVFKSS